MLQLKSYGCSLYLENWESLKISRKSFDVINIAAMYLSSNPVFLAHTKHIEVHFHFVREQATQKLLQIKFISSQLADIFTKSLPLPTFEGCRCNLNLLSISGHS
jgi:hypothetical protein